ncbi:MAG: hypothetical protein A2V86_07090 [Deltaproteobacteria bacterium RBG_16_49_23]|nr:MAG: hypothetical protein A2V86_07090 [Deltaproteobacteria bacterium RBG_16_49_23]
MIRQDRGISSCALWLDDNGRSNWIRIAKREKNLATDLTFIRNSHRRSKDERYKSKTKLVGWEVKRIQMIGIIG